MMEDGVRAMMEDGVRDGSRAMLPPLIENASAGTASKR